MKKRLCLAFFILAGCLAEDPQYTLSIPAGSLSEPATGQPTVPPMAQVDGTGITNHVAKFQNSNTIGSSQIYDNGSFVGIGTTIFSGAKFVVETRGWGASIFTSNGPSMVVMSTEGNAIEASVGSGRAIQANGVNSSGVLYANDSGAGTAIYGSSYFGYSGRFIGGKGLLVDGQTQIKLPENTGATMVCGTLNQETGLFVLGQCDERIQKLEARLAALEARLGPAP